MARPQVFGRQRRGSPRGRDTEFPAAPKPVSSHERSRDALPRSPHHQASAQPSRGTLDHRPSTSGGTTTRKVKVVQKQETRDDLHFNAHRGHEIPTTFYNFPLPSSLPTPMATPRSSPPRVVSSELSEPEVVALSASIMDIGMALGSPSHQPVSWNSKANFERPRLMDSPESIDQREDWRQAALQPKPKTSKWKKFGGLFGGGKKNAGQAQAFYQLQPDGADSIPGPTTMDQHYTTFPSPPSSAGRPRMRGDDRPRTQGVEERPRTRGRTNTVSEKKTKQKPEIKRSQTAPMEFNFQNQQDAPKASKSDTMKAPEIQLDGGPLLNVDIPRIELERYSVMFDSFLSKPSGQTSSNLLARRQATLDKLKLVNEAIAEHERTQAEAKSKLLRPRRATSPQPTKSPAFSLFPTTPYGNRARSGSRSGSPMTPRRTSPLVGGSLTLHRSNTSPAALSPNRQTFANKPQPEDLERPRVLEEIHTIMLAPTPPLIQQEQQRRANASNASSPWLTKESHLVLSPSSSFVSDNDGIEIHVPQPLKPVLVEPSWEMVPPPTQGLKSPESTAGDWPKQPFHTQSSRRPDENMRLASPLARNPSQSGTPSSLGTRRMRGKEESNASSKNTGQNVRLSARRVRSEEDAQAAAEASIARQISMSQQQRNLLLPIATPSVAVKSVGASASSTPVTAVRQMTPKIVQVGRQVEAEVGVLERA